jgi:hypothetical protein
MKNETDISVFKQMLKPSDQQVRHLVICDTLADILADYCLVSSKTLKTHPSDPPKA